MHELSFRLLIYLLLIIVYFILLDYFAQFLYTKRHLPLLAGTLLVVFACLAAFVYYLYKEFDNNPVVIMASISCVALFIAVRMVRWLYHERRYMRKEIFMVMCMYFCVVLYLTLFFRMGWLKDGSIYMKPFEPLRDAIRKGNTSELEHAISNMLLFMPMGILMPLIFPERKFKISAAALVGFSLSTIIEMIQLVTLLGQCNIDDIISNAMGTMIGCALCVMSLQICKNWKLGIA